MKELVGWAVFLYMETLLQMKPQDTNPKTRWTLIDRIKNAEDAKSWNEFDELYREAIFGAAKRAGLQDEEAKDVVQETMASVAKNIAAFEANSERGSFRAWLFQMARWRIKDQFAKRLPVSPSSSRSDHATATTPTVERIPNEHEVELGKICDDEWQQQLLKKALQEVQLAVKPEHYQIFHLLEIERKPVALVAQMVRQNPARLYVIKFRVAAVVKKIAKRLEKNAGLAPQAPGQCNGSVK